MAVRTLPMYDLAKPVGPNKPNLSDDVRLIQSLFQALQQAGDFLTEGSPNQKLTETNPQGPGGRYAAALPELDDVQSWVAQAKGMRPRVTH